MGSSHSGTRRGIVNDNVAMMINNLNGRWNVYDEKHGNSALHWAASLKAINCCKALLEIGDVTSINTPNIYGRTPLDCAAYNNSVECAKMLLSCRVLDVMLSHPLHSACIRDVTDVLRLIINDARFPINRRCEGLTPIHVAVANGSVGCLRVILDTTGVDVNLPTLSEDRSTALHLAVESNRRKCVDLLLESSKIRLDVENASGELPIDIARRNYLTEIATLLENHKDLKRDPEFRSDLYVEMPCKLQEELMELGMIGTSENNNKLLTPSLVIAANEDNDLRCELLIDVMAVTTIRECPAMCIACWRGHADCVSVLMNNQYVDINRMFGGYNALHFAVKFRHLECAELLLQGYATDINATTSTKEEYSCLHLAVLNQDLPMLRILLNHADLDRKCAASNGENAEQMADRLQYDECVKLLQPKTPPRLLDILVITLCINLFLVYLYVTFWQ